MQLLASDGKRGWGTRSKSAVAAPSAPAPSGGARGLFSCMCAGQYSSCDGASGRLVLCLAEQPLSEDILTRGFVRCLLFHPLHGKTGKKIRPKELAWLLNITSFAKSVPQPEGGPYIPVVIDQAGISHCCNALEVLQRSPYPSIPLCPALSSFVASLCSPSPLSCPGSSAASL